MSFNQQEDAGKPQEIVMNRKNESNIFKMMQDTSVGPYKFGRKPVSVNHSYQSWNYLRATSNDIPSGFLVNKQGSRHTKFGNGFYRRNRADIISREYDSNSAQRPENTTVTSEKFRRPRTTNVVNTRRGYNIINGNKNTTIPSNFLCQNEYKRTYLANKKSDRLVREGEIALRDSMNRFYIPKGSGTNNNNTRTSVLNAEGLSTTVKKSSELGVGRSELLSSGAIEATSQSLYLKTNHPQVTRHNTVIPSASSGEWKAPVAYLSGRDVEAVRNLPK